MGDKSWIGCMQCLNYESSHGKSGATYCRAYGTYIFAKDYDHRDGSDHPDTQHFKNMYQNGRVMERCPRSRIDRDYLDD